MSPAAAAARATSFAATFSASTAPSSRGLLRRPFRGDPAPRRAVASMAVSAPRSPAAASFLERRESERALHFVKYHGLGNDFIMVRLALSRFFLIYHILQRSPGDVMVLQISCSLRCFPS
jgi:diaminopimelate epimerase